MSFATIPCSPWGELQVEWECEFSQEDSLFRTSVERLLAMWLGVWPQIYQAFQNTANEYDHDEQVRRVKKHLVVVVPNFAESEEPTWSVTMHTEPFVGVYDVQIKGRNVIDAGVSF